MATLPRLFGRCRHAHERSTPMNIFPNAAAIVAGAVLAVVPGLGAAAAPSPYNTITLQSYRFDVAGGSDGVAAVYHGHVYVTFRNDGEVPATAVTFEIVNAGEGAGRIEDVGTFVKGARIEHAFHWTREGETLRVAQVRYADGTTWDSDDAAAPTARRQAR
jgi:hypothetical protein